MRTSDELLKMVNDYIEDATITRQPTSLYDPIKYVLSIGGKRIRPVLLLLTYNMYRRYRKGDANCRGTGNLP